VAISFALGCGLFGGPETRAREWLPEFESFSEAELDSLGGPGLLTPEYAADLLSYRHSSEREYRWLSSSRVLNIGFGSLNTTRFLTNSRLKINRELSPGLEFRFHYFDDSDLERHSLHQVLELILKGSPWLSIAFYGEPSFRKPNDDTGLALLFHPGARHEVRLYKTFVDVTRLRFPDGPDTFVDPELPHVLGLVGRAWSLPQWENRSGSFVEYSLRGETPTRWRLFDRKEDLFYWRWAGHFYCRHQFSEALAASLRLELDRKRHSRPSLGDWFIHRYLLNSELTFYGKEGQEYTVGVEYQNRLWVATSGHGTSADFLPYARVRTPGGRYRGISGSWALAYLVTWHGEKGAERIGIHPGWHGAIEQRLNISYEFSFGEAGKLLLMGSADVDELGTRNSWDGGSGQLELYF
jgi:hypothetical protein